MSLSTLIIISTELNRYGYPICLVLGNIGNFLVVSVFSQHPQNACVIYLISSAIMNNIYLTFNSFIQIFPFQFIDERLNSWMFCKTRLYLISVLGQIAKSMIILACFDRFMFTSNRASFRAFSTRRRAKSLIIFVLLFWPIVNIHIPIMTMLSNGQCILPGISSTIFTFYMVIFIGLIPVLLLSIFGYLTYRHVKQMRVRVQPIETNHIGRAVSNQRRDRQLLAIVLSEVLVYVLTAIPYSLGLLEMTITRYLMTNKSIQQMQIESLINNIAVFLLFVNSAAPFYIYFIASKPFRRDLKQMIIKSYRILKRQAIIPNTIRIRHQTLEQRDTRV